MVGLLHRVGIVYDNGVVSMGSPTGLVNISLAAVRGEAGGRAATLNIDDVNGLPSFAGTVPGVTDNANIGGVQFPLLFLF